MGGKELALESYISVASRQWVIGDSGGAVVSECDGYWHSRRAITFCLFHVLVYQRLGGIYVAFGLIRYYDYTHPAYQSNAIHQSSQVSSVVAPGTA